MHRRQMQFTIRGIMIAVAIAAVLLFLLQSTAGLPFIACLASLALAGGIRALLRRQRRRAAWGFGIAAVVVNGAVGGLSIYALSMLGAVVMVLVSYCGIPLILGFGAAWATAATRTEADARRSPILAWPLVVVLAVLPLTMMFTHWPLRLAFAASESALDRLADRVAAGQPPVPPLQAGVFEVLGTTADPSTGNVGLITNTASSGRSGFVRVAVGPGNPRELRNGPFYNLNFDVPMGGAWWYQNED